MDSWRNGMTCSEFRFLCRRKVERQPRPGGRRQGGAPAASPEKLKDKCVFMLKMDRQTDRLTD